MMLTHCGNNVRNRYSGCVFSVKDIVPVPLKTSRNQLNGSKGAFELVVRDADDRLNQMPAKRVVLATGAYDRPNLAGVPGEEDATVRHYFHDWEPIENQNILFVGGGFYYCHGAAHTAYGRHMSSASP